MVRLLAAGDLLGQEVQQGLNLCPQVLLDGLIPHLGGKGLVNPVHIPGLGQLHELGYGLFLPIGAGKALIHPVHQELRALRLGREEWGENPHEKPGNHRKNHNEQLHAGVSPLSQSVAAEYCIRPPASGPPNRGGPPGR